MCCDSLQEGIGGPPLAHHLHPPTHHLLGQDLGAEGGQDELLVLGTQAAPAGEEGGDGEGGEVVEEGEVRSQGELDSKIRNQYFANEEDEEEEEEGVPEERSRAGRAVAECHSRCKSHGDRWQSERIG